MNDYEHDWRGDETFSDLYRVSESDEVYVGTVNQMDDEWYADPEGGGELSGPFASMEDAMEAMEEWDHRRPLD